MHKLRNDEWTYKMYLVSIISSGILQSRSVEPLLGRNEAENYNQRIICRPYW